MSSFPPLECSYHSNAKTQRYLLSKKSQFPFLLRTSSRKTKTGKQAQSSRIKAKEFFSNLDITAMLSRPLPQQCSASGVGVWNRVAQAAPGAGTAGHQPGASWGGGERSPCTQGLLKLGEDRRFDMELALLGFWALFSLFEGVNILSGKYLAWENEVISWLPWSVRGNREIIPVVGETFFVSSSLTALFAGVDLFVFLKLLLANILIRIIRWKGVITKGGREEFQSNLVSFSVLPRLGSAPWTAEGLGPPPLFTTCTRWSCSSDRPQPQASSLNPPRSLLLLCQTLFCLLLWK